MAATPWLELLIVIPIGIGAGLNPLMVGAVAFAGNALPVFLLIYAAERIKSWRWIQRMKQWFKRKRSSRHHKETPERRAKKEARKEKLLHIFEKYGVAGLALAGPALTGIHLATIFAMAVQANKRKVAWWMNASLALWTFVVTFIAFYGVEWFKDWFS